VTPRVRVFVIVALAAAAAAGATVGITLATSTSVPKPLALRPGAPPLVLDLGLRSDPEAQALRRAAKLYDKGKRGQAAPVFARYSSLEAKIGSALAAWPDGRDRIASLARENPKSGFAQLELGLAEFWTGQTAQARLAWRETKKVAPDSLYGIRASDLLHPDLPVPGIPQFVPTFGPPPGLGELSAVGQVARLRADAGSGGARAKILYGVALQRLNRPVSAEAQFAAAAKDAPSDPEAQAAAAVGLFDKDNPARAFSRLGPLTTKFPHAVTVRFHLGLLLLWLGQVAQARKELRLAYADAPESALGHQAQALLLRLQNVRTR
jgi:tetratricopeptide (TPR) repeat protein